MAARLLFDARRPYKPRLYREINAEPYSEEEFRSRYSLTKESVEVLTHLLKEQLHL